MAIIKPFRAVRPAKNYVDMVAELPYDVMNREEAKKMGEGNKYSFIHIDRAEVDLDDNVDEHDEAVYLKAKENLDKFKDEKILIKEKQECIYIYREIIDKGFYQIHLLILLNLLFYQCARLCGILHHHL